MSTPATLGQSQKLLALVSGYSLERIQDLLGHGYLVTNLLDCPDLSKVDKSAHEALLAGRLTFQPPQPLIPWMPVGGYADRIMARSQLRGWGFTQADRDKLNAKLHDHNGPLTPTGVSLWLGKNLKFNWAEIMAWLEDEVKALDVPFQDYFGPDRLSFYPGSEVTGKRKLGVVDLDLATFWDKTNGLVPKNIRPNRPKWPGLEVAVLLALNPQVYVAMDGKTIPYMFAPGLVVDSDGLPRFDRDGDRAYVYDYFDDDQWSGTSVVAFRE